MTMKNILGKRFGLAFCASLMAFGFSAPASAQLMMDDSLCPEPAAASKQTPDDLAGVQADIERFALCLKRAELLKSLNELAQKNTDSLIGMNSIEAMVQDQLARELPPLAPNALSVEESFARSLANPDGDIAEEESEDKRTPWLINDIYGVSSNLSARITSKEGDVANVRQGDILPDGMKVISITQTGITIDNANEKIALGWAK